MCESIAILSQLFNRSNFAYLTFFDNTCVEWSTYAYVWYLWRSAAALNVPV